MEFILLLLIAILLFGGKAVKRFAAKAILFTLAFILIPLGGAFIQSVLENPNWYVLIPSIVGIVLLFLLTKGRSEDKTPAEPNAHFGIAMDQNIPYIKIVQKSEKVYLSPLEVKNLLFDWKVESQTFNEHPFVTMYGTAYKLIPVSEVVNNDRHLIHSLQQKGVHYYIEIKQFYQHSHQTNDTLYLNPQAILSLNQWMETAKEKHPIIDGLYVS